MWLNTSDSLIPSILGDDKMDMDNTDGISSELKVML